jgi:peptidoglycan/xylan/chitin deacetylase (PgdA/CDA1 family)
VDVRGAFASEVAVVDSLHQSPSFWRPPGRQARNTRDHVHFIGFPKEIRPAVLHLDYDYSERRTACEKCIEEFRCNETLRRIVRAFSLERYGRPNALPC